MIQTSGGGLDGIGREHRRNKLLSYSQEVERGKKVTSVPHSPFWRIPNELRTSTRFHLLKVPPPPNSAALHAKSFNTWTLGDMQHPNCDA
jgi:hypothetical protein